MLWRLSLTRNTPNPPALSVLIQIIQRLSLGANWQFQHKARMVLRPTHRTSMLDAAGPI